MEQFNSKEEMGASFVYKSYMSSEDMFQYNDNIK